MGYAAISIGVFLLIFSYLTLNAPVDINDALPVTAPKTNFCELIDSDSAPTFQAPADNITKTGSEDDETLGTVVSAGGCGGTQARHQLSTEPTTYQMIRKNVPLSTTDVKKKGKNFTGESCHFSTSDKLNIEIPEIDRGKFKVFYPQISGEITLDREIPSRTRGRDSNLLYFIDYGLVFLLHLNPDGSFTEYQGTTSNGTPETFYLADVYRDIGSNRPELPKEAFECSAAGNVPNTPTTGQILIPDQKVSTNPGQLQLQYFVFSGNSGGVFNGWGIHCKPAIYLYPPSKQLVNVKVFPSGFLTYVDPPYDKEKGWTVETNPGGTLFTMNHEPITNNYLYFESKVADQVINKPSQGWVIANEKLRIKNENTDWFEGLRIHFQEVLPKLGLNSRQTQDFIDYWSKALPEAPYYFVGIIDRENVDQIEKLEITPKPDFINRIRVYFERLDSFKHVEAPKLSAISHQPSADSFAVVEWGGMVKTDPNHPFTCSQ